MKRFRKILVTGIILLPIIFFGLSDLNADRKEQIEKDLIQKKKDLKDIRKELSIVREKEKKIKVEETSILDNIHLLEKELFKKERELKDLERQLTETRNKILKTKEQISSLSNKIDETKMELHSRLNGLYKMGRIPPETFLLGSSSFQDLLKLEKYFKVIIDADTRLIETYRYQAALKEKYKDELVKDQNQLEKSIFNVERKREEVKKARESKATLLRSIQNQKLVYRKLIAELEERSKELQKLIDKLEKEKTLFAYKSSKLDSIKGKLIPPVNGKVISLFKERGQNGIEIQAPMGTEVRAVLPGKVLYADWFKGFGNLVIIDHGNHTFTVSGYLSQVLKKAGDTVSQGEVIALVGSQGSLKGPCLYFEIRQNGKPQDPMHWLSPLEKVVSMPEAKENKK